MNETIQRIAELLDAEINSRVDAALEEKLPDIIRALGLRDVAAASNAEPHLVGALDVAKYLGYDVSNQTAVRKSLQKVYRRVHSGAIPCARAGRGKNSMRFDLAKVKAALSEQGQEKFQHAA